MSLLKEALSYLGLGFSVIPVGQDKRPLLKWSPYQERRPTPDEIRAWFTDNPSANLAVITGTISGIVVIDVEAGGSTEGLPPTVTAKTQGGGWHYYYKHPGKKVITVARIRDLMDVRGDGGYALLPPSKGPKGSYEWIVSPNDAEFEELPEHLLSKILDDEKPPADWDNLSAGVSIGNRNQAATQVIGKMLAGTPMPMWKSLIWPGVVAWNDTLKPPMSKKELLSVWESITQRESKGRSPERTKILDQADETFLREFWPNFQVFGGTRQGESVVLETSAGALSLSMEDLFQQFIFHRKVFSSFGVVLESQKREVWHKWLTKIAPLIKVADATEVTINTVISEVLEEMAEEAISDDLGLLRSSQPVRYKDGIAFRFNDFLVKMSRQKGVVVNRSEIRLALNNHFNVEKKETTAQGKFFRFMVYYPTTPLEQPLI